MNVLVLEHGRESYVGLLEAWANERGHSLALRHVPTLRRWPSIGTFDLVVCLGSDASMCEPSESWIESELHFLRATHDAKVPLLGICFGAQALAVVLGAEVSHAPTPQIGWIALKDYDPEVLQPGPWFFWHEDTFSLPPGSHQLARSPGGIAGFQVGQSVGLQFHPEVSERVISSWTRQTEAKLDPDVLHGALSMKAIAAGEEGARLRAIALFDQLECRWGGSRLVP